MTLKQLQNNIIMSPIGYGTYKVTITYRGKRYHCHSNNSMAYDMLNHEKGEPKAYYNTQKQARQAVWNECKYKNELK